MSLSADEVIDRVLAVAAGDLITLGDVRGARDLGLVTPPSDASDPIRDTLLRLIDRALILAEVERYAPPEPSASDVARGVQSVRDRFPTVEAFNAVLARAGIDENRLRGTVRQDLRMQTYMDQRFTVVPPGDEDIARYYREHTQAFTRNGVLVPLDEARPRVVQAATAGRRQALVDDWVGGLRRRADIIDLYSSAAPAR